MPEIEPLKIPKAYKVSSSALNRNVIELDIIPNEIRTANGVAIAHTERQAIAMILGRYGLLDTIKPDDIAASLYESACDTESGEGYGAFLKKVAGFGEQIADWLNSYFGEPESQEQRDMLDILHSAATDKGSKYYSPGYVEFLNWVDALKKNYKAYLIRHADKVELANWKHLPRNEKPARAVTFLKKHGIHDKRSGMVNLIADPTKKWLLGSYRRILDGEKKPELVKRYNDIMRGTDEEIGNNVQVQMSLDFHAVL